VRASQTLVAEDRTAAEKLLDLRFQLKSVLAASEWVKVVPFGTPHHDCCLD